MPPDATPVLDAVDPELERRRARRGTVITLAVLLALVTLVVLLTPVSDNNFDTRLTVTKYGPGNARLAADLARRLGWDVRTEANAIGEGIDTTAIYAVFAGPTPMTSLQRAALLRGVRRGAGLLVAPSPNGAFSLLDSLGLHVSRSGLVTPTPLGQCAAETDPLASLRTRTNMLTFDTAAAKERTSAAPAVPYPAHARPILTSQVSSAPSDDDSVTTSTPRSTLTVREQRPSIVGFPLGRGRVVAMADPDLLRTDQLRNCAMGTALSMVRSLEYLSEGRQRRLIFEEYYQIESSDGAGVVVWEWLRFSAPGRALLTLMAAGLLWLMALGRRTLAPVYRAREERRSALEHVDALATAWQSVRGTRTVARMLARGIRRRHAAGRWRTLDDTAFLAALAERHPAIADDAARITIAIDAPAAPSDLPALREAAAHIDAECLTP
jgi:hypothetical protein